MTRWIGLALLLALGCDTDRPPPVPIFDGNGIRDGGTFDAPPVRVHPTSPVIDGEIKRREWEGASVVEADVATDRDGSTLSALYAVLEDDRLVIGVEGTVAGGDSIVVYVDRDFGEGDGVDLRALEDDEGLLDRVITQRSLRGPAGFAVDFAWGTTRMPFAAIGRDDAIGWRDVRDPDAFEIVDAEDAPSACSARGCEAAIPRSILGGTLPRTVALFARIVRADGGFTNQTLPEDDASAPAIVRALLTLDDGFPMDAGMPDGGVIDGGGGGAPVVDGVIDPDEWAGAAVIRNAVPAAGIFEGNALTTLRALRDETHLHVAIEGRLTSGNAILMYVDGDYGGFDGVVSPTPFMDPRSPLNQALSKELVTEAEFRTDVGWGTTRMNQSGASDTIGWRDVATDPTAFRVLSGTSACSANACETSIPLSALGTGSSDEVALFVRLGAVTTYTLSNQCLPPDDPDFPTVFARLPPP